MPAVIPMEVMTVCGSMGLSKWNDRNSTWMWWPGLDQIYPFADFGVFDWSKLLFEAMKLLDYRTNFQILRINLRALLPIQSLIFVGHHYFLNYKDFQVQSNSSALSPQTWKASTILFKSSASWSKVRPVRNFQTFWRWMNRSTHGIGKKLRTLIHDRCQMMVGVFCSKLLRQCTI